MKLKQKALFYSIIFHGVLFILAFSVFKIRLIPATILQQIEIVDYKQIGTKKNININPTKTVGVSNMNVYELGKKNNYIPDKVELPTTLFNVENDLETVDMLQKNKISLNDLQLNKNIGNSFDYHNNSISQISPISSEELLKDIPSTTIDNEYLDDLLVRSSGSIDKNSPYLLEGEVLERNIVNKIIPKYPRGLQKNSKIKISFKVLSNGIVTSIIVIKKGDPILEKISIDAIKKWRFNAIPDNLVQTGTITFEYILK